MRAGDDYDLAVIGAGSGGLTAAAFGASLGARIALIERRRVGGDCTWTGCVPSKALLKAAKVAHEVRVAATYGVVVGPPQVDMSAVRDYVRSCIAEVYQHETPDELQRKGVKLLLGHARFVDARTLSVGPTGGEGERLVRARSFLIATGGRARVPQLPGLDQVPYSTYEDIFDNARLPDHLVVIGAGPIGMELAQAYRRLGARVTVVGKEVLAKEEPEAVAVMRKVFHREGIRLVPARPTGVIRDGNAIGVDLPMERVYCDLLLIATGRAPMLDGLGLDQAGVLHSAAGISVDAYLRTNVRHIYAAGDVLGGAQFTHLAGWQGFQAARTALLPGKVRGLGAMVPRVTYTDPEVAHVGLTEAQAREPVGRRVSVVHWPMERVDRAVCESDREGFVKLILAGGKVVGTTIVAARAGEAIGELGLGIERGLSARVLAGTIRAYPTYSTGVQQALVEATMREALSGRMGKLLKWLVGRS